MYIINRQHILSNLFLQLLHGINLELVNFINKIKSSVTLLMMSKAINKFKYNFEQATLKSKELFIIKLTTIWVRFKKTKDLTKVLRIVHLNSLNRLRNILNRKTQYESEKELFANCEDCAKYYSLSFENFHFRQQWH